MTKPPRPNQRILYMRPNCAANKAVAAFYFSWLNKKAKHRVKKSAGIHLIQGDIF
ncbi:MULTISPECIES: hypothetical protein [Mesorhizobium]|uniref:Uncharacterized protein n=1 Tax=Mesorhizobium shonense TaxID=1209948 RepID=A0ABV2HVM8_9HYPH|nr:MULTISPECIES: hypothetical protein [unclassified Mesorhizobium]